MKTKNAIAIFLAICLALLAPACKNAKKQRLIESFKDLKASIYLPKEVAPGLFLDDIALDEKDMMITYTYSTTDFLAKATINNLKNPRGLARYISTVGVETVEGLADCDVSLHMVYTTSEGDFDYTIPNAKIKEILKQIKSGEVQPGSFLEITREEFANTQFPQQIDDYTIITAAWVNGNEIIYQYVFSDEIDTSLFTDELKEEMRQGLIDSMRTLVTANMADFQRDGIVLKFHYFDTAGNEVASFTLTGADFI